MNKRIGLCLSGCGVNDGSEIHESVITILSLYPHDVNIIYLAPNIKNQMLIIIWMVTILMKIVSTPAYMLAKRVTETAEGINKLVNKIVEIV